MRKLRITIGVALALVFFFGTGLAQEKTEKRVKVREVEAVISDVGQRTITFQVERKGKVREEAVGIDDKSYIERISREKVSLRELQKGDKVYIRYEEGAYTPALSVQVVGKGEVKKAGGGD